MALNHGTFVCHRGKTQAAALMGAIVKTHWHWQSAAGTLHHDNNPAMMMTLMIIEHRAVTDKGPGCLELSDEIPRRC